MTVTLHQWNDQNVQLAFPGLTAVGSSSGERVIEFPGTQLAGTRQSANAITLAFSPLDLTNNKVLLARRAIPMLQETFELFWRLRDPTTLSLIFYLTNDESIATSDARYASRAAAIGDRDDLSIT